MKNTALEQFEQQNWKPRWQSSKNNHFKYLSDKFDLPRTKKKKVDKFGSSLL